MAIARYVRSGPTYCSTNASGALAAQRASTSGRGKEGRLLREGIHVVLAGRPNVGKSSLLNRLAGEERAIVTSFPGTTRDALREAISIEGVPLTLVDTAGLRTAVDEAERLGVERTHREVGQADLVIAVFDATAHDRSLSVSPPAAAARIDVYNKVDLLPGFALPPSECQAVAVSAKTGAGIDSLRRAILDAAGWKSHGESVFLARERHLRALQEASAHLEAAAHRVRQWELFAEELRLAQGSLGAITGEVTADALLGEIFARFCIGK